MPNTKLSDITAAKRLSLLPDCEFNVAHRLSYASVLGDAAERTARRDARRVMLPSKSVEENLMSTSSTAVPNARCRCRCPAQHGHHRIHTGWLQDCPESRTGTRHHRALAVHYRHHRRGPTDAGRRQRYAAHQPVREDT